MILRPEQRRLMALGLPTTPANKSSSSSSNPTTTNTYQDKRNAVSNGIGTSGDNNTTLYSTTNTTTVNATDGGAIAGALGIANTAQWLQADTNNRATLAMNATANTAISTMADVAQNTTSASQHFADIGLSMLQGSNALTNSLATGSNNLAAGLFSTVGGLYRDAAAQETNATQIAANLAQTQVAAQNDNRYLIAAGLAVVCIVGVMAFSHKG